MINICTGSFANDLRQLAEVKDATSANNYLSQFVAQDHGLYPTGGNMATSIDAQNITSDEHFVKTNGIKIISGRDFHLKDSLKVLINETLCKRLGFNPQTAIGQRLFTEYPPNPVTYVVVAGVMKDFNYSSLHGEVKPFMLVYSHNAGDFTSIVASTNSHDYKTLLAKIETIWHKNLPAVPFEYAFLDAEVQKQYETEITLGKIINSFTLMAILISCLGLFGLAAFSAEQRSKEIGIRKVLGASVSGIVGLLSKDFLILIVIAMLIAAPVAWYGMGKWLQGFAYKINLSWWMFALAAVISIIIALVTISFQAIRAALANPVKSLKSE